MTKDNNVLILVVNHQAVTCIYFLVFETMTLADFLTVYNSGFLLQLDRVGSTPYWTNSLYQLNVVKQYIHTVGMWHTQLLPVWAPPMLLLSPFNCYGKKSILRDVTQGTEPSLKLFSMCPGKLQPLRPYRFHPLPHVQGPHFSRSAETDWFPAEGFMIENF